MLLPPVEPMLAKPLGHAIPAGTDDVAYEPKWDGFRCLAFHTPVGIVLQGRGRSRSAPDEIVDLAYAFPEIVDAIGDQVPPDCVIDAEIVAASQGRLDFGALSSRLRPRSEAGGANIARLAQTTPATLLAFDILWSGSDLMPLPFRERRAVLEELADGWRPPLFLTPSTTDATRAQSWFDRYESAGVDGLIVKPLGDPYAPGKRAQGKVKHQRTADVVVAGWRPHTRPGPDGRPVVGSLLLGMHDDDGMLHYVGAASAFSASTRADLVDVLAPMALAADDAHPWRGPSTARVPGEANRWKKEQRWTALRPLRVAEVAYDQMEGDRFRHVARFIRWRPDRAADSCAFGQLETPEPSQIEDLLGSTLTEY